MFIKGSLYQQFGNNRPKIEHQLQSFALLMDFQQTSFQPSHLFCVYILCVYHLLSLYSWQCRSLSYSIIYSRVKLKMLNQINEK